MDPIELDYETTVKARAMTAELMRFLDRSPCSYFATDTLVETFAEAGFTALDEGFPFSLQKGGKYMIERHDSSLIAFVLGSRAPSEGGFRLVASHTDSPCLKLKPQPERLSHGLVHLGIELYGGPLLATWMDRDLGLCGRVMVSFDGDRVESRLIRIDKAILSIPNVAIHMNRKVNDEGLKLNPQTEIIPILAGSDEEQLPGQGIRSLIADQLDIEQDQVIDFDLVLYDTQPASFGGTADEFVRSGRLDDLAMCHAAMTALIAAADLQVEPTRLAVFYDSEEVGSQTPQGARSNFLPTILERITISAGEDREGFLRALAGSLLISADNAHAVHPGYADQSEPNHSPRLNRGPVVKVHASHAYATDAYSAALFELICRKVDVPCQRFVNRSDARSGGTIGSMTAAQLGIPTVDVGNPQLAMHSIREMAGTYDHYFMIKAMTEFFSD